jgi:hypothetical protein
MSEWVFVDSSNIEAIRYLDQSQELEVRFLSGAVYTYHNVPQEIYEEMLNSDSKGSYLNRAIKRTYEFSKQ